MGLNKAIFRETVPDDLICAICKNVYDDPVSNTCPHVFCLKCISKRLRDESSRFCPVCHTALNATPASPPKATVDRILSMKIICTSKCGEVFELKELKEHLNSICHNTMVTCENEGRGCKEKILRKNVKDHLTQCIYRKVTCEACGHKCLFKDLATHQRKKNCLQIKLKQDIISSVRNANKEIKHHCRALRDSRYQLKQEERKERQSRRHARLSSAASCRSATSSVNNTTNFSNSHENYEDPSSRAASGYSLRSYASSRPSLRGPRGSVVGGSKFLPAGAEDTCKIDKDKSVVVHEMPRPPHPSRNEDVSPRTKVWCKRCDKPFIVKNNHSAACSFHRGPMGMCESCGRLDIHKGCLNGYHIAYEDNEEDNLN